MIVNKKYLIAGIATAAFLLGTLYGADNQAAIDAPCFIPRVASEYETIRHQLEKCEADDSHAFCEAAEDYTPTMQEDEAEQAWSCLTKNGLLGIFPKGADVATKAQKGLEIIQPYPLLVLAYQQRDGRR